MGGLHHRPVTTDVGHRGEHIERLGPGDPGHGIHRQSGHSTFGERLDKFRVERRGEQGDDGLATAQPVEFGRRRRVDLEENIALPHGRIDDVSPCAAVGLVVEARERTRAGLDEHGIPEPTQLLDGLGSGGDTALAGGRLLGDSDAHRRTPLTARAT